MVGTVRVIRKHYFRPRRPALPERLSSYLDVVDAQRVALQAESQEAQLRGQRAVSTICLAKTLGGGWEQR